jgi:biopolymer transport protein ExbB
VSSGVCPFDKSPSPTERVPVNLSQLAYPLLAQVEAQGWLTTRLLRITLTSAEWVLWLLAIASVASVALILERLAFYAKHSLKGSAQAAKLLDARDYDGALRQVGEQPGLEACLVREGVAAIPKGPDSVEEVLDKVYSRERPRYERYMSFLGTLGSNAPFIGLFGTVLGIIKAFADLGALNVKGSAIQQTVMRGISEALVATAVGLAVAIPAVIAFNLLTRQLKTIVSRGNVLRHTLLSQLRTENAAALVKPEERIREVR